MQSDVDDVPPCFRSHFTQFSAGDVDHQTVTLDGCGSLHGMGVMSTTTPCSRVTGHFAAVTRVRRLTVDRIIKNCGIPIASYVPEVTALSTLKLKPLKEVTHSLTVCAASPALMLYLWI